MARRSSRKPATPDTPPSLSPRQGLELLGRQIEKGELLLSKRPVSSGDSEAWVTATREVLVQTYGSAAACVSSFAMVGRIGIYHFGGGSEHDWEADRAKHLRQQ